MAKSILPYSETENSGSLRRMGTISMACYGTPWTTWIGHCRKVNKETRKTIAWQFHSSDSPIQTLMRIINMTIPLSFSPPNPYMAVTVQLYGCPSLTHQPISCGFEGNNSLTFSPFLFTLRFRSKTIPECWKQRSVIRLQNCKKHFFRAQESLIRSEDLYTLGTLLLSDISYK